VKEKNKTRKVSLEKTLLFIIYFLVFGVAWAIICAILAILLFLGSFSSPDPYNADRMMKVIIFMFFLPAPASGILAYLLSSGSLKKGILVTIVTFIILALFLGFVTKGNFPI